MPKIYGDEEIAFARQWAINNGPHINYTELRAAMQKQFQRAPTARHLQTVLQDGTRTEPAPSEPVAAASDLEQQILDLRVAGRLPTSIMELCDLLDRSPAKVREALRALEQRGALLRLRDDGSLHAMLAPTPVSEPVEVTTRSVFAGRHVYRFGLVADSHIGHQAHRDDANHAIFDFFAAEGVVDVFVPGNYLEGVARFNRNELAAGGHTLDGQCDLFAELWPQKDGITTWLLSGDDHEGWWAQQVGMDPGAYLVSRCETEHGRTDLQNLGYLERDVILRAPNADCVMRIAHPGGGSAYAKSYVPQKIVESYQGGEKPDILLIGHYHKQGYFMIRNVHVVLGGTMQDQSTFMRKKRLDAEVGAWLVEIHLDDDGVIRRFTPTWIPFYDRPFYTSLRVEVVSGEVKKLLPAKGAWKAS